MEEKIHNNTRIALILLFVTITIVIGLLGGDLLVRTKAYLNVKDQDDWEYGYRSWDYDTFYEEDDELWETESMMWDSCMISSMGGVMTTLFLLVGITLLFSSRKAYGDKHSNNLTLALILLIFIFIITPLLLYIRYLKEGGEESTEYGYITAIPILLFLAATFMITRNLGGRKYGLFGLLLGAGATVPLFFVRYSQFEEYPGEDLKWFAFYVMLADIGLMIAFSLYLASIKKAMDWTRANPASPEHPLKEEARLERVKRDRFTKKGKKRLLVAGVVFLVILSAVGVYWFFIRVPSLEEFMQDSYSDGETAKFKDKVVKVEVIETSYGTVTLVAFEDYYYPFCFMGDRSGKYREGKTVITELEFHKYNIDGVKIVLPEELILGQHLGFGGDKQYLSSYDEIKFQIETPLNGSSGLNLNITSLRYSNKTYSLDYYETAFNQFYPLDKYCKAIEDEYGDYPSYWISEDIEPGTLIYDFHEYLHMESVVLMEMYGYYNCTDQKTHGSYLPDRYEYNDNDNDENLSVGDSVRIELDPTSDRYTINNYLIRSTGITSGSAYIMNWYKGPFYSLEDNLTYLNDRTEEDRVGDKYSYKIIFKDTNTQLGISELEIDFYSIHGSLYSFILRDGMNVQHDRSTISFKDDNKNGFLDEGDYFQLLDLDKDTRYSLYIDGYGSRIYDFITIPGLGRKTGNYPILSIQEPERINGNISINVSGVEVDIPNIRSFDFEIFISRERIPLAVECDEETFFGYDSDETVKIEIIDSDDNGYLTPNDIIEISGLEPDAEFIYKIWYYGELLVYEWEGTV